MGDRVAPKRDALDVLFVSPVYAPFVSGSGALIAAMARRLIADGHRVTVLTTNAREAADFWRSPPNVALLPARQTIDQVTVQRLPLAYPWPAPYAFGVLRRLGLLMERARIPGIAARPVQRFLSRWMPPLTGLLEALDALMTQADVVHSMDASWDGMLLAAGHVARARGKPWVVQPLMHWGSPGVRSHFTMAHQIAAYQQASAVITLSPDEGDAIIGLGVPAERVRVMRMGVDVSPVLDGQAVADQSLPKPHASPMVAFLGANTVDKGATVLLEAIIQLNLSGTAVDVVFAGPQAEALQEHLARQPQAHRRVIDEHVRVLGVIDETAKHELLSSCSLLAVPSQVETFGIVFLEAWLHGKPVVGAAVGGIPALVEHGRTGLLVPFGDVPALSSAIRALLDHPDRAAELGAAGRQTVLERYTWDHTYATLRGIYAGILDQVGREQSMDLEGRRA